MPSNCLFCRTSTLNSKSEEHIIPLAFGSKKKLLPPGFVCDKCNNYFSIKIEQPLLAHSSMRNIRAFHQVSNRKGKMPSLLGTIAGTDLKIGLKLGENGQIVVQPEKESERKDVERFFHNQLHNASFKPLIFPIEMNPPAKLMSRFLAKMALEAMIYRNMENEKWVSMIIEGAYYNTIRDYARYGKGIDIWPFHQRRIFPIKTYMKHPDTADWVQAGFGHDLLLTSTPETYFVFLLYGEEFVINLGGPSIKGYEFWLHSHNNISPMVERFGLQLVEKETGGKTEYYLQGEFDANNGILFDQKYYKPA